MEMLTEELRLALPKGRMEEGVFRLLADAGIEVARGSRTYRPAISLPATEVKILKPQNIVEMLQLGSRDVGFAGADWVAELGAEVISVFDTALDPVRIVAAVPCGGIIDRDCTRPIVVASEYESLTKRWAKEQGLNARVVRSYGATEVFPPEDADLIVDNSASGATLRAANLEILDVLMTSSTRLYASIAAWESPTKRRRIEELALLLRSVLDARKRVIVEVNIAADLLEKVAAVLPAMRRPTISSLHAGEGFAVKAAVPREELPTLIPLIKAIGGTDIVVSELSQVVP